MFSSSPVGMDDIGWIRLATYAPSLLKQASSFSSDLISTPTNLASLISIGSCLHLFGFGQGGEEEEAENRTNLDGSLLSMR